MQKNLGRILFATNWKWGVAVLVGLLGWTPQSEGVTMNLNRPYHEWHFYRAAELVPVQFSAPEHPDFLFPGGRDVRLKLHSQLRTVAGSWQLFRNMGKQELLAGKAEPSLDGGFELQIPMEGFEPGFYDVEVEVDFGSRKEKFLSTFGYDVEGITLEPEIPEDFLEFWQGVERELEEVPFAAEEGPWRKFREQEIEGYLTSHAFLPSAADPEGIRFEELEAQEVAFDSLDGFRVHANVAKPPVEGRLPTILILPGAGGWNAIRPIPLEAARHGYLAMDVAAPGVGSEQEKSGDDRREHAGFSLYANALQALRYLRSRPDVDPERIAVAGMSQGGRLSFVLAALNPDLVAAVPGITHFTDVEYQSRIGERKASDDAAVTRYFDVLSFAAHTKVPLFLGAGLVDRVSPAATVYHAFLVAPAEDKTFVPMPGIAHFLTIEHDRRAWRWLEERLPPVQPAR